MSCVHMEMRLWLGFLLAACADEVDRTPAPPVPIPVVAVKPAPPPPPLKPAITSIHPSPIRVLAVTEDATAAITSDLKAGLRLWPTLDGTHEPVVVHAPAPVDLAIGKTGDELSVAIVDQANALTIIRFDREGRLIGRAQVGADVIALQATTQGFLVVTSDQAVELYEYSGVRWGRLPAKERIAALVYRNGRALALHETSPQHVKGRWIDLLDGARWGDETAELAANDVAHAVLSPDHTRLAVQARQSLNVLDLATAASETLASTCDPIGYLDDDMLACQASLSLLYLDRKGKLIGTTPGQPSAIAVANHQLAYGYVSSLAFSDAKSTHYLGYRISNLHSIRESGLGTLYTGAQRFIANDKLDVGKLLKPIVVTGEDAQLIDSMPISAKLDAEVWRLDEYSHYLKIDGKRVLDPILDSEVHFEPATGLVAQTATGSVQFVRVANDKVGPRMELATSTSPLSQYFADGDESTDTIYLLDPALADGRVAIVAHGKRIHELRELAPAIHPAKSYTVDGAVLAVDRAGHIFKRKKKKTDVTIHGTDIVFAGTADTNSIAPSPDGKLVAFGSLTSIALFASDGTLKWRIANTPDRTVTWAGGKLLARSYGTVTLDLATGETIAMRCGWGFGISQTPLDDTVMGDVVCDR